MFGRLIYFTRRQHLSRAGGQKTGTRVGGGPRRRQRFPRVFANPPRRSERGGTGKNAKMSETRDAAGQEYARRLRGSLKAREGAKMALWVLKGAGTRSRLHGDRWRGRCIGGRRVSDPLGVYFYFLDCCTRGRAEFPG